MKGFIKKYLKTYSNLSTEIWILSFITFINRAGAMVIPFLSIYLQSEKGFTLPQIGIIMTCYGLGSLLGNYIGGILTDKIGFYKTIVLSLIIGGISFVTIQFVDSYSIMCVSLFLLMVAVDTYRPGVFVAAEAYGNTEDTTRNIGLIRLFINLGFSIGPLIGGILIAKVSYTSIFWIDGITCIIAAFLLILLLKPKKANEKNINTPIKKEGKPALLNKTFLLFFIIMIINSVVFVQYFSTVPLFYKEQHHLSADIIGWLMFLNGALIVFFEMPLIAWLERIKIDKTFATLIGILLLGLSIIILNTSNWFGILVIGMILMTLGEMIGSPFSSALALELSPKGRKGSYMGLFSMSFSLSHVIGHNLALNSIDNYGFSNTWTLLTLIMLFAALLTIYLYRKIHQTKKNNVSNLV